MKRGERLHETPPSIDANGNIPVTSTGLIPVGLQDLRLAGELGGGWAAAKFNSGLFVCSPLHQCVYTDGLATLVLRNDMLQVIDGYSLVSELVAQRPKLL